MAELNIKSLVPSVYINRVTLESKALELRESNPHIDSERDPNIYRDPITGKIKREETRANLFKKSVDSNLLTVKIDFIMKEKMDSDVVSSWFDLSSNRELLKYFKVKVIQSLDEDFTSKLLQASSLLEVEAPSTIISKDVSIGMDLLNKNTTDYYTTLKENGVREYDMSFSETFILKDPNPKHLAYFSACYLDLDDLMKDYGLEGVSDNFRMLQGKVNAELIIKEYGLVSNTFLFMDDKGSLWDGQVTKIEQDREIKNGNTVVSVEKDVQWIAGDGKSTDVKYLQLKMIPNTKIQDFRHVKELEKELLDFSIIDNSLINQVEGQIKMPSSNEIVVDVNKKKAFFSNLSLTRDKSCRARFFFGIDLLAIARQYTIYGKLFKDNNLELMNHIKIRYMKLKRYRVSSNNNAIKDNMGIAAFNEDDSYDLISVSGEKQTFDFVVGQLQNGTLREIVLDLEPGVRFFTGIDKNMEGVTFGLYQYAIEMEIEDGTIDFLKDRTDLLLNSYEIMNDYCQEAQRKGNYDPYSDRFTQKFIEAQENIYQSDQERSPWRKMISSYLSVLDLLIDNFDVEKYSKSLLIYTHPRSGSVIGISMLLKLVESLLLKLSSVVEIKSTKSVRSKIAANGPVESSSIRVRGILPIHTIKIEKVFDVIFDSDIPKNIGYDFLSTSEFKKEINDDGLSVVTNIEFEDRTNQETTKYFKSLDTPINLKTATLELTTDDNLINNKYRFLTPSVITIDEKNSLNLLNRGASLLASKQYEKINTAAMYFNFAKKSPRTPLNNFVPNTLSTMNNRDQETKSILTNMISSYGVSLTPISRTSESDFVKSSEVVSVDSNFVLSKQAVEQLVPGGTKTSVETNSSRDPNSILISILQPEALKGMNNKSTSALAMEKSVSNVKNDIKFFNLNEKNNVITDIKFNENAINLPNRISSINNAIITPNNVMIKELPNQIKSIMLASVDSSEVKHNLFGDSVNILSDSKKKLGFQMNYNVINEVEVFDGYERALDTDSSYLHIKKEKWVTLTPNKFKESYNKNLLCRMIPYNNKQFGVERPIGMELPTYNEYFILSPIEKIIDKIGIVIPSDSKIVNIQSVLKNTEKYLQVDNANTFANSIVRNNNKIVDSSSVAIPKYEQNISQIALASSVSIRGAKR